MSADSVPGGVRSTPPGGPQRSIMVVGLPGDQSGVRYQTAIVERGHRAVWVTPQELLREILLISGDGNSPRPLWQLAESQPFHPGVPPERCVPAPSSNIFRGIDGAIINLDEEYNGFKPAMLKALLDAGIRLHDSVDNVLIAGSKVRTHEVMSAAGVPVPMSIPVGNPQEIASADAALGRPYVIKVPHLEQCVGVRLITSGVDLNKTLQDLRDSGLWKGETLLFQEFVDFGEADTRLVVHARDSTDFEIWAAVDRTWKEFGEFGWFRRHDVVTPKERELAAGVVKVLGRGLYGLDVGTVQKTLPGAGRAQAGDVLLLEVNVASLGTRGPALYSNDFTGFAVDQLLQDIGREHVTGRVAQRSAAPTGLTQGLGGHPMAS